MNFLMLYFFNLILEAKVIENREIYHFHKLENNFPENRGLFSKIGLHFYFSLLKYCSLLLINQTFVLHKM